MFRFGIHFLCIFFISCLAYGGTHRSSRREHRSREEISTSSYASMIVKSDLRPGTFTGKIKKTKPICFIFHPNYSYGIYDRNDNLIAYLDYRDSTCSMGGFIGKDVSVTGSTCERSHYGTLVVKVKNIIGISGN